MAKFYVKERPLNLRANTPIAVYQEFKELAKADQETSWLLGLDSSNNVILKEMCFLGGLNQSMIDPRVLFKRLLVKGASNFILIHNHILIFFTLYIIMFYSAFDAFFTQ